METLLDFRGLAQVLLSRAREFLPNWLPGGKFRGREYVCGNLQGGPGDSFSVNSETGAWADFSTTDRGGDLVSLYAAINNLKQGEAAKQLADLISHPLKGNGHAPAKPKQEHKLTQPLPTTPPPAMVHLSHGPPSSSWVYEGLTGGRYFYVARYDLPSGKQIVPWSWCSTHGKWEARGWPAPRPLYNLSELSFRPDAPVLLVEGEKSAVAAKTIAGRVYVVMTWPNGSQAVSKADWTPLYGRKVILWPDADEPGRRAMAEIASILGHYCPEVKLLSTDGLPEGWDAADALAGTHTSLPDWSSFAKWAKPRVSTVAQAPAKPAQPAEALEPLVIPIVDPPTARLEVMVSKDTTPERSQFALWEQLGLERTNSGQPIMNIDNIETVFSKWPDLKDFVWYDEFHQRLFTTWRTGKRREWSDVDTLEMTLYLQRSLKLAKVTKEAVADAVQLYGSKNVKNEPRDWMDTLVWDGTSRIEHFFASCLGAEDGPYTRAASRNFWLSMAARVYRPGCQQDHMVVLEGPQGVGKTKALRIVGGPWYCEAHESVTDKDFFQMLRGKLLVEIAELDSFGKAEVTKIKQVITCTSDRYRVSYGRHAQDYPRMCVFAGSTNDRLWQRDPTGGRRFWPIICTAIDFAAITELRDVMFAEATARFKAGEPWYLMPADETRAEQDARRQTDEWEEIIREYLDNPTKAETTVRQVAIECLKFDPARLTKQDQMRVASCLAHIGWLRQKVRRGEETPWVWMRQQPKTAVPT